MHQLGKGFRGVKGFTLIELLVVIAIIAILAGLLFSVFGRALVQTNETKTISNMRQMGIAMISYATDHNNLLPNRVTNPSGGSSPSDKWPVVLLPYLQNTAVYTSPIPDVNGKTYKVTDPSLYSNNGTNYTSYIYNGMNDVFGLNQSPGADGSTTSSPSIRLNTVAQPAQTILLGIPYPQTGQFYMDFLEDNGNNNDVLNKNAFSTGSVYMFCDGSSRYLVNNNDSSTYKASPPPNGNTYTDWLWLFDKSATSVIH